MTVATQPKEEEETLVVTVEEAAKLLRIGRGEAYRAVNSGQIPCVRIGKRILVPRVALTWLMTQALERPA